MSAPIRKPRPADKPAIQYRLPRPDWRTLPRHFKPREPQAPRPCGGWDIDGLIKAVGGPRLLRGAHAQFGFKPLTSAQIANWRARHSIPSDRLAEFFITVQTLLGKSFNPFDYITVKEK